jgi:hypothetical protein
VTDQTCPDPEGLDEQARLALAVIFGRVCDATSSAAVQMWAHSVEDRLLGYDEPALPLDALADAELCAVHPILVAAAAACTDKPYRQWLVDLGRMMTEQLDARTAEQMLRDAQFDALIAEEQRREHADRPPENLEGLQSWRKSSGPAQNGDRNPVIDP